MCKVLQVFIGAFAGVWSAPAAPCWELPNEVDSLHFGACQCKNWMMLRSTGEKRHWRNCGYSELAHPMDRTDIPPVLLGHGASPVSALQQADLPLAFELSSSISPFTRFSHDMAVTHILLHTHLSAQPQGDLVPSKGCTWLFRG